MMLLEDRGKRLFREHLIPVPSGRTVTRVDETAGIELPVAIKALVPVGGRGKAGGVVVATSVNDLKNQTERILGMTISGHPVRSVLLEEALDVSREMYLSILIDRSLGVPTLLASSKGGVDIETLPEGAVHRWPVHPFEGIVPYMVREVASVLGLSDRERELGDILGRAWRLFISEDCELVEINPLVLTRGGMLIAADAKIAINDDALFRHPELAKDEAQVDGLEAEARRMGIAYVGMDGDIGVIANGAGLTMATLDEIALRGRHAGAFMDLGGTDDPQKVEKAFELMARSPSRAILINIFGGITKCDVVAEGVLRALERTGNRTPIVVRIRGINEDQARSMLRQRGIAAHVSLEDAVDEIVQLGGGA
jgi:succinyl-CoA synthetase beta subunit